MEGLDLYLNTHTLGRQMRYEHLTSSTQVLAHEWAAQGAPEGAVVIAEEQKIGRGRSGKEWHSPPETGIWMSLILRPCIPLRDATHFTLLSSVAVQKGIQSIVDLPIQVKWPNDLLVHGKKICGILTEVRSRQNQLLYMVIGIGVNVNTAQKDFPPNLQKIATSLRIECDKECSRPLLIASILEQLEMYYAHYVKWGFKYIREEWEALSNVVGRSINANTSQGKVSGKVIGLTDKGELVIKTGFRKCIIHSPIELL